MTDITSIRLFNQQIEETNFKTAKEIVGWMGAMQAQDESMMKWGVGVRLPNSIEQTIESAINNGDILRTHLLRPTWHLVSADDIYWMLELTAPQIKAKLKSSNKDLEITDSIVSKSNAIIRRALNDGDHLTRRELIDELNKNNIRTNGNRAYHLFLRAELDGIICSGSAKGKNQTYALLEKRIPKAIPMSRETAMASLAKRYFTSHGPATLQDFAWWSGLSVSDARVSLDMVKSEFVSETIDSQMYWFLSSSSSTASHQKNIHLLPAYDEFIISYKDRGASLPIENFNKVVSNNGLFRPIIVVNGQVIGIWKRTIKKEKVIVETDFFKQPNKSTIAQVEAAAVQYGRFLEKETELVYQR